MQESAAECKCKMCGGSGWIDSYHLVPEWEMVYGRKVSQTYARRCPSCSGMRRADDAGFPPEYSDTDITKIDQKIYGRDVEKQMKIFHSFVYEFDEKWWKNGKGLYLWGKTPGAGRTYCASCLGRSIAVHGKHTVKFVVFANYLEARKKSFNSPPGAINRELDYQRYYDCDLLILDDLGAEGKCTEFVDAELFRLVNDRMGSGKVTIYTSNIPAEELPYSNRTISRILNTSLRVHMPEIDVRLKLSAEKEEKFLEKILA